MKLNVALTGPVCFRYDVLEVKSYAYFSREENTDLRAGHSHVDLACWPGAASERRKSRLSFAV